MTPDRARKAMHKIADRAADDPKQAIDDGIALLCELARLSGYWRAAETFEHIRKHHPHDR